MGVRVCREMCAGVREGECGCGVCREICVGVRGGECGGSKGIGCAYT